MERARLGQRILIAVAVLLAMGLALSGAQGRKTSLKPSLKLKRDFIAVVPIYGEIRDSGPVVRLLRRYREEVPGLKAVVLALDTPGGGVAASQEICEAIYDLQESNIVVVAAMGSMAASGGYYVAAPADRILADAGTLTGSIGVIMETVNASRVLDKVGLGFEVIKSGEFKDSGNFTRALSAREKALFQDLIDDVYGQFLQAVMDGRKDALSAVLAKKRRRGGAGVGDAELMAYVRSFSDGRVFTGRKALELGLVDELGGLDRAIEAAAEMSGAGDPEIITYREHRSFAELLTGVSKVELKAWMRESLGARARRFGFYAW